MKFYCVICVPGRDRDDATWFVWDRQAHTSVGEGFGSRADACAFRRQLEQQANADAVAGPVTSD